VRSKKRHSQKKIRNSDFGKEIYDAGLNASKTGSGYLLTYTEMGDTFPRFVSLEERIKAEAQEQLEVLGSELKTLKTEKKQFTITQQLADAQLPKLFANDVRLVNADIDDIPKVIKELKKEYAEFAQTLGQNAVGGTAPKVQPSQSQGTNYIDALAKANPQLAKFLKQKR